MSTERFRLAAAVYGVLRDGDRVLFMRRAGSGYHDGELSLPAGHLDGGEDALTGLARELREELNIIVDREACSLVAVLHRPPENEGDQEYLDLFFAVDRWTGTVAIGEPNKCSELVWAELDALPDDAIDHVRAGLHAASRGPMFLPYGWNLALTATRSSGTNVS